MNAVEIAKEFLPAWMPLWVVPLFPVVVGFLAASWARIRAFYERMSTFLVAVIRLDADLSAEVLTHLGTTAKTSSLGAQGFIVLSRFVRSKNRQTWVLGRWLDKEGEFTFWYPWRGLKAPVWVTRGKEGTYVSFRFIRGTFPIKELLASIVDKANNRRQNRYTLIRVGGAGARMLAVDGMERNAAPRATCEGIRSFTSLPATSFYLSESHEDIGEPRDMGGPDDLWLPSELAAILEDARTWSRGRTWYQAHRLPWRRGYLIYGLPGTGKTSLARAIGMDLDLPIYAIDLPSMNNRELSDAFTAARSDAPCMLLFEDFDAVHNGRLPRQPNQQLGTPPSFDLLLNQIQGIGTNDGIMVIITTNHLDAIDHALGGPARVDVDGNVTVGESHSRPGRIDRICRTPDTIDAAGRRMLAARMLPNADMDALLAETEGQTPAQFQDELLTRAQATL